MNTCRECRFSAPDKELGSHELSWKYAKCVHPRHGASPVTGEMVRAYCSIERKYDSLCGAEGKYFEARFKLWGKFLKWMQN